MNKVVLLGRLVRDPEVKYAASGKVVCKFTLAVDRPYAKDTPKEADFISCVVFGKVAETVGNNVNKGQRLLVSGSIRTGSYTDKQGNKRYTTDVWVDEFEFVEKRGSGAPAGGGAGGFGDFGNAEDMQF